MTRHLARFHYAGEETVRKMAGVLEGHVQRPWTVERLTVFFAGALRAEQRAAAVFLLAASRDPNALRAVGNALYDREPPVRVAAARGIVFYWIGEMYGGENAESLLATADKWWRDRTAMAGHEERR